MCKRCLDAKYRARSKGGRNDAPVPNARASHWRGYERIHPTNQTNDKIWQMLTRLSHGINRTGNYLQISCSLTLNPSSFNYISNFRSLKENSPLIIQFASWEKWHREMMNSFELSKKFPKTANLSKTQTGMWTTFSIGNESFGYRLMNNF